jgi:hypothetical protein
VTEMAHCLMEAADLLDEGEGAMRSAEKQASQVPEAAVPANLDHMGAKNEEEKGPSNVAEFRRSLLRRRA